jgi:hypothetical protein
LRRVLIDWHGSHKRRRWQCRTRSSAGFSRSLHQFEQRICSRSMLLKANQFRRARMIRHWGIPDVSFDHSSIYLRIHQPDYFSNERGNLVGFSA